MLMNLPLGKPPVLYQAFQSAADVFDPMRLASRLGANLLGLLPGNAADNLWARSAAAAFEVFTRTGLTHARPPFEIDHAMVGGRPLPVVEEATLVTPFGTLLRFRKVGAPAQPKVLIVAPMSGHFATLLRGTVVTMLPDHDVHITDWHNARDVPLDAGGFDLDAYVTHLIDFLAVMGPRSHVVAVCQPTVATLAAVAVMAQGEHPALPASMTLMAGPIDARVNPTAVNELATSKPMDWFEENLIGVVPWRYRGACRRVYPGFLQISAFMSMNRERHQKAFNDLYWHRINGEDMRADTIAEFYAEYLAVADLPAEFYLETVDQVFQRYLLARGELTYQGRLVEPAAISRTALLTVEGEKDDICSLGQTLAAQELCNGINARRKLHHVQPGVGHYGVFNGRRWSGEIYPVLREFIFMNQ
jgi:polyhydroxyalkanoate depolymerase